MKPTPGFEVGTSAVIEVEVLEVMAHLRRVRLKLGRRQEIDLWINVDRLEKRTWEDERKRRRA